MRTLSLLTFIFPSLVASCAIVTTPVKVVGKAVTTTMDVSGKVIGTGVDVVTPGSSDEDSEDEE